PFDALTFTDIGTRYGPEHPNAAQHPAPARPAVASADLTSRDNNLTIRAYIVSAIAVLGASLLGGLVILSHLRGRPAVVEDSEEDLS
ncbi:MAG: peptidase S8, partial [Actinomyces sp.]